MNTSDCRFSILTPTGRGAVATLRVEGEAATKCVGQWFRSVSGQLLPDSPVGRILFGHWKGDTAQPGEEVVVCRTSPSAWEIHCHGGMAAVHAIASSLTATGCASTKWQEAIIQSSADAIVAEAHIALARATTQGTSQILLDQLDGALSKAIAETSAACARADTEAAAQRLAELISRARIGLHLCQPWKVVLAGHPNVGKSSLLNAIVGHQRSIVFDQPGTTRDVLTERTAIEGWPVELADTAGLRESDDEIETAGVTRARAKVTNADLTVLVFDASVPWTASDEQLLADHPNALIAHNKCDLSVSVAERPVGIHVSALSGAGVSDLIQAIAHKLVPDPPPAGAAVPFTQRQLEAMEDVRKLVNTGDFSHAAHTLGQLLKP